MRLEDIMENYLEFKNKFLKCIKKLILNHDISFVLNNLEDIIFLPVPFREHGIPLSEHELSKKLAISSLENAENKYKNFEEELELRESSFSQIREIYPGFCITMKGKVSDQDYEDYLSFMRQCTDSVFSIMHMSLSEMTKEKYAEHVLKKKDLISSVIDSEVSCRLSKIQDEFLLNELNNIDCSKFNETTQTNIVSIKEELTRRLEQYKLFYNLYNTKNEIRLEGRGIDE